MNFRRWAYLIIGFTLLFVCTTLYIFLKYTNPIDTNLKIDPDIFGNYGSLVGGVTASALTIASIFLIIQSLNEQNRNFRQEQENQQKNFETEQRNQRISFEKQLIETRFFELIKMHRENVADLNIGNRFGLKIFQSLRRELNEALVIVRETLRNNSNYSELDVINIAYQCFFYGSVGPNSTSILQHSLINYHKKLDPELIQSLFKSFEMAQDRVKSDQTFSYKPFEGHQSRLSRYFRHIFQSVKYINNQSILTYKEKYDYVKTLRAQLSTQEQLILFFNSLSSLGIEWEKKKGLNDDDKLITKYNLIKNIPMGYSGQINLVKYYPDVDFEGTRKTRQVSVKSKKYT